MAIYCKFLVVLLSGVLLSACQDNNEICQNHNASSQNKYKELIGDFMEKLSFSKCQNPQENANETTNKLHNDNKENSVIAVEPPLIHSNDEINNMENAKSYKNFPKASSTWGNYLNPNNELPTTGYQVYYMHMDNPKQILQKDIVQEIYVKYVWDEFLGITSEKFGAYWVGNLVVDEPTNYQFNINQSWSKSRIILNGHILNDENKKHNQDFQVFLPKGKHKLEVEFMNGWHTTEFGLQALSLNKAKPIQDPKEHLMQLKAKYPNIQGIFASVYEPEQREVQIQLANNTKPTILFLGSYEMVDWKLINAQNSNVVAVVYGGYTNGTRIFGVDDGIVFNAGRKMDYNDGDTDPNCRCHTSHFHCENTVSIYGYIDTLYQEYGIPIVDFNAEYRANAFIFPNKPNALNPNDYKLLNKQFTKKIDDERQKCKGNFGKDFESVFKEQ